MLDFEYTDEDIDSLRKQMELPRASTPDSVISDSLCMIFHAISSFDTDRLTLHPVPSSPAKRPASPASSILSGSFDREPPNKKRRVSYSSLSDADSDSDEEERPLAAQISSGKISKKPSENGARPIGQRSGKQMKSVAHTAPTSRLPPTDEERAEMDRPVNGVNGHNAVVKVEDKMDESQLNRLATGVTVDASGGASTDVCIP